MITWSCLSARPKTATELNVTGSRFVVFLLRTFTSSPTRVSLPFQGLTCSLTMSWHHFRRSSGSLTGISVGLSSRVPNGGVPGGAPGALGSTPLRNWFRNWMRMVTVTPASPFRLMSYETSPPYFLAAAVPPVPGWLYKVSSGGVSLMATRWTAC